jgi:hypothetical protein
VEACVIPVFCFSPAAFLRVPPFAGLPGHAIIREFLSGVNGGPD